MQHATNDGNVCSRSKFTTLAITSGGAVPGTGDRPRQMAHKTSPWTTTLMGTCLAIFFCFTSLSPSRSVNTRVQRGLAEWLSLNGTDGMLAIRTPPTSQEIEDYRMEDYFVLHQFENAKITFNKGTSQEATLGQEENFKMMVKLAAVTAIKMLTVPVRDMLAEAEKPTPDMVSFLRYFKPDRDQAVAVSQILLNIATAIGHPLYAGPDAQCSSATRDMPKIDIYYGDPPANIYPWPEQDYGEWACKPFRESDDSPYPEAWDDMIAYQFDSAIAGQPGGIVLCDKFFRYYRSMEYSDSFKQYVRGYIDFGFPNDAQEPTYTSASVLLHELLHHNPLYPDWFKANLPLGWKSILDVEVFRDGKRVTAYGARAAWHVNHGAPIWDPEERDPAKKDRTLQQRKMDPSQYNSTCNVDNYLSLIKEIYYRNSYGWAEEWQDPPRIYWRGSFIHGRPPQLPMEVPDGIFNPDKFFNRPPSDGS